MSQNVLKVKVLKKAGDKTVVGKLAVLKKHPVYKKYVKVTKKYMIHDESNRVQAGEEIFIKSSRPISKRKTWIVVDSAEVAI